MFFYLPTLSNFVKQIITDNLRLEEVHLNSSGSPSMDKYQNIYVWYQCQFQYIFHLNLFYINYFEYFE